jgi:hypothetical protein
MHWPHTAPRLDASPMLLRSPFHPQVLEKPSRNSAGRASQRRCHCSRPDCPIQSSSSSSSSSTHPFDRLPWISALDLSPEDCGLSDIADLSQLPVDDANFGVESVAGPVRRRKSSLHRTSPLRAASGSSTQSTYPSSILRNRQLPTPCSPRPRLAHSRIVFHDLMPLFTRDTHKYRSSTSSPPAY